MAGNADEPGSGSGGRPTAWLEGAPGDDLVQGHERTMQQFLALQERVMTAYLSAATGQPMPQTAAVPRERPPVWITGLGMVTPLGIGWQENWQAMCAGTSGIQTARDFDPTGLATRFGGEIHPSFEQHYKAQCRLPFQERYSRFTRFAMLSAKLAIEDAGIAVKEEDPTRIGICIGVGAGSFNYLGPIHEALRDKNQGLLPAMDHNYIVKCMANAPVSQISIWLGLQGPSTTIGLACASGASAIGTAIDWIRNGHADVVLAGGTDATVNRFVIHAYNQINALSIRNDDPTRASRPFDRTRDGFVMAEGAGILVLESEAHARRRGANRYATLVGHATTSEAYNIVAPRPAGAGMARTMGLALADAGVHPDQVGYVSAHGTSTPLNDASETMAIKTVLGQRAFGVPVSALKSMIGHAIGASSAIQAAVTALTLRTGVVTPTINYQEPDPECDLDYVPNQARQASIDVAIANAFGFGGHNCSLVFGR
jgi:3-oxoacyl-[acyl-carrier-protein] synthase II